MPYNPTLKSRILDLYNSGKSYTFDEVCTNVGASRVNVIQALKSLNLLAVEVEWDDGAITHSNISSQFPTSSEKDK